MTTISNNPFDTQSADPGQAPARDDPANIDLGATQPIDITALMAEWDLQSLASSPSQPSLPGPERMALEQGTKAS